MSLDRFIYFETMPDTQAVTQVIQDFFGEAATYDTANFKDRLFISFNSKGSFSFKNMPDLNGESDSVHEERWIEVIWGDDYISVLTRQQDHFVSSLATGLHDVLHNYFSVLHGLGK